MSHSLPPPGKRELVLFALGYLAVAVLYWVFEPQPTESYFDETAGVVDVRKYGTTNFVLVRSDVRDSSLHCTQLFYNQGMTSITHCGD